MVCPLRSLKRALLTVGVGPIDPSSDFSALGSAQTGLKSSSPPSSASVASSLLSQLSSASRALARTSEIGAGVTLEQLSARYSSFARPYAGTDAAPIGGYKQVVEKLWEATEARGNAKVKLEEEVKSIKDEEDGVTVQTSKATYRAKTVICTIPLAVLQAAPPTFSPPLESPLQAAIKRTQVGLLDKVILVYDEPWWDAQTGTFILLPEDETEQPRQTDGLGTMLKRTTVVVDNLHKTAASKLPALLVPLGATAAHVVERHSDDQVVSTVHKFLAKRIGGSASEPKETLVVRWGADPYARGATSAPVCLAPGVDAADQPTPLDFVQLSRSQWDGRLGFAGEHTDFDHRGSVVGALLSGEREAKRVLGLLTRSNETAKL